jgi:hypothetical protein
MGQYQNNQLKSTYFPGYLQLTLKILSRGSIIGSANSQCWAGWRQCCSLTVIPGHFVVKKSHGSTMLQSAVILADKTAERYVDVTASARKSVVSEEYPQNLSRVPG